MSLERAMIQCNQYPFDLNDVLPHVKDFQKAVDRIFEENYVCTCGSALIPYKEIKPNTGYVCSYCGSKVVFTERLEAKA